jgi:hypothetical protein
VRKQVNQLDNLTTSKAVDALLNAETVALFGNRHLEVREGQGGGMCRWGTEAGGAMAGGWPGMQEGLAAAALCQGGPRWSYAAGCTGGSCRVIVG